MLGRTILVILFLAFINFILTMQQVFAEQDEDPLDRWPSISSETELDDSPIQDLLKYSPAEVMPPLTPAEGQWNFTPEKYERKFNPYEKKWEFVPNEDELDFKPVKGQ